jgi:hypothetical protein
MITLGPSLTGLRGTQVTGSIIYTLVRWYAIKLDGWFVDSHNKLAWTMVKHVALLSSPVMNLSGSFHWHLSIMPSINWMSMTHPSAMSLNLNKFEFNGWVQK